VIFFRNPSGLDDRAVAGSVRAVERSSNAVVLTDHVDAVERYGKLVEDLGVSQTPSIVLIDHAGDARLIEGFIDPQSLTQAVADAR
jgi:thioredoxin-related protein